MTSTRRTATTRSAATTENTVQRNGTTARQRVLIAAAQAKAANLAKLAEDEKAGRVRPITGGVTGYDPVTGDFIVATPDGGEIRAQNLSTGAPTGSVPVQRFPGSQRASFNAPPSQGDQGAILAEIEASQRDVFNALNADISAGGVETPTLRHYELIPVNDARRRVDALSIRNRNGDDTSATNETGVLKRNGSAVTLGTTILEVGDRLSIEITNVGTGSLYWAVNLVRV
jgi:hypothetical protein